MATSRLFQVHAENTGLLGLKQTDDAAATVSDLLQQDLDKYHVFFNDDNFHDHLLHQVLALYGTGSPPTVISAAYDRNASYQNPTRPAHPRLADEILPSTAEWDQYLGNEDYYPDFLAFFQREIDAKGWRAVVSEYLFAGTARSETLLSRMFSGFVHPLIQLMYGLEWEQPATVAQALSQAAVHQDRLSDFFTRAEALARSSGEDEREPGWTVESLYAAAHDNPVLRGSIKSSDGNKLYQGVFGRALEDMTRLAARVRVRPIQEELDARAVEMFQGAICAAASGAVSEAARRGKEPRFDFFLMHHINVAPIFATINRQDWIPAEAKARLLEWKIRSDLAEYVARGSPALDADAVLAYVPKDPNPASSPEDGVLARIWDIRDDGHCVKLARALLVCAQLTGPYSDRAWAKFRTPQDWVKIHYLVLDATRDGEPQNVWVRTPVFDEAWENVPDKN